MNEKIVAKKQTGYIWIANSFVWLILTLFHIFLTRHENIDLALVVLLSFNVLLSILNAFLTLSGNNYLLISDKYVKHKMGLSKPKTIQFEDIKSVYRKTHFLRKALFIEGFSKSHYIYDDYGKTLDDIEMAILQEYSKLGD